jgi:hypothetical protein
MTGQGGKLGRKKEDAILALLSQRSVEDAARVAGVGTRTLYRWMKQSEFDAAYRDARYAVYSQSTARLQQMRSPAVSILAKALVDPNSPLATKVKVAEIILDHTTEAMESEDLPARLVGVERLAEMLKARLQPGRTTKRGTLEEG